MTCKKRTLLLSFFVMVIIVSSSAIASAVAPPGGQKYYVNGYVQSSSGVPIGGASVALYMGAMYINTVTTQSNGYFSCSTYQDIEPRTWKAVVSKTGYETTTKTVQADPSGTTSMGIISLVPTAPPIVDPVIGSPSVSYPSPISTQITVSVTWHYDPYVSRSVYLEFNGESLIMQPMGGNQYFKKVVGSEFRSGFTYNIKAIEKWYEGEPPELTTADAITGDYVTGNNPWTESIRHSLLGSQGAGTNYQMKFVVHYGSGINCLEDVYCDYLCQIDFNDIRFVSDDDLSVYDHWVESITPGESAVFWVEVRDNLDNDAAIKMYYGNGNALSTSNGAATFIAFDDFEDYTLGAIPDSQNGWTNIDDVYIQNNPGGRSGMGLKLDTAISPNSEGVTNDWGAIGLDSIAIHYMWYCSRVVDRNGYTSIIGYQGTTAATAVTTLWNGQGIDSRDWYTGAYYTEYSPQFTYSSGIWYEIEDHVSSNYYHSIKNSADLSAGVRNTGVEDFYSFSISTYQDNRHGDWFTQYDDFFVRKWIENEPAHGNWESTNTAFIEDGSIAPINNGWGLLQCFSSNWPYPLDEPSYGYLYSNGNSLYTYSISTDPPNTLHGPVYHKPVTNSFMLQSLSDFHVSIERIINDVGEHGSFHISVNDEGLRPIVDIQVYDCDVGSHELLVTATYVDEKLGKYTTLLASGITTSWSGDIDIWYEKDVGILARVDASAPITIADATLANKYRSVAHVTMQSTRYGSDPIPNFQIDEISLETHSFDLQVDLCRASYLRSGPRELALTEPGPTNEIQMFPAYSEPLIFQFEIPSYALDIIELLNIPFYINIDAIPVSYSGQTCTSWIEIRVNDYLVDCFDLDWNPQICIDPITGFEVQNYIQETTWIPNQEVNTIELRACGSNWDPMDIIALRGIWVHCEGVLDYLNFDLKQLYPDSGELTYFVPMGSDTLLYFKFEGTEGSSVNIFVDGIYKGTHDVPGMVNNAGIELGNFIRGTLHELTVVYHETISGISPAIVTMHTSFHWLTVEIDYVAYPSTYTSYNGAELHFPASLDGGIWTSFSDYLTDMWTDIATYYEVHTHGRLSFIIDDAIPWNQWDQNLEFGSGFSCAELVDVGRQWFDHDGDRDYLWVIYGDNLAGAGGYQFSSDYGSPRIYNGWERWSAIAVQWHHYRSATWHELGHAAHITGDFDSCECPGCVMPYNGVHGAIMCYCQYHWFQTWYNKVGQSYMWISEWWLR